MNRLLQILLATLLLSGLFEAYNMRLYNLENRALHADESEQSFTFSNLYFNGEYKYNANGPHGPILYYYPLKLVHKDFDETLDAKLLRRTLLPIWFLTCGLVFFSMLNWRDEKDILFKANSSVPIFASAVFATLLFAYSSVSQIYSTYFIQEPFFALFSLALCISCYSFFKKANAYNAISVGLCAGLLQATKETSVIVFAALVGAWILSLANLKNLKAQLANLATKKSVKNSLFILAGFVFIYCIFYSSFFSNFSGILDGIKSYGHFFEKSVSQVHTKGFSYYLELLSGLKSEGAIFGETATFVLAILGTSFAYLRKNAFIKFVSVFGWLNILALSFIGYKTPWLLLAPLTALALPAGYAVGIMIFSNIKSSKKISVIAVKLLIFVGLLYLFNLQFLETRNASRNYASDPRNPFLYVHTLKNEEKLVKRIFDCAKVKDKDFKAICISKNSPWPLPWQTLKLDSVSYHKSLPKNFNPDDFDIVMFDSNFDESLNSKFKEENWIGEFFGLRQGVLLRVNVKKELFYKSIK